MRTRSRCPMYLSAPSLLKVKRTRTTGGSAPFPVRPCGPTPVGIPRGAEVGESDITRLILHCPRSGANRLSRTLVRRRNNRQPPPSYRVLWILAALVLFSAIGCSGAAVGGVGT